MSTLSRSFLPPSLSPTPHASRFLPHQPHAPKNARSLIPGRRQQEPPVLRIAAQNPFPFSASPSIISPPAVFPESSNSGSLPRHSRGFTILNHLNRACPNGKRPIFARVCQPGKLSIAGEMVVNDLEMPFISGRRLLFPCPTACAWGWTLPGGPSAARLGPTAPIAPFRRPPSRSQRLKRAGNSHRSGVVGLRAHRLHACTFKG